MPFAPSPRLSRRFRAGLLLCVLASALSAAPTYTERYRPQYHFTPPQNWMNDPNGLVYFDGEYHLFYQYNPFGIRWGHMSWGHAVSRDLLHWENLPVAIPEEGKLMAFSGSAVVDWKNTSGFGRAGRPPLVAIYTGHVDWGDHQSQYLAYSNDCGRTWTNYAGNPVLDLHLADFRDPKVWWYAPGGYWLMVVSVPKEHQMSFYRSPDLKQWTLLGKFGPAGVTDGQWECPDLFELPVRGEPGRKAWVLVVNVDQGAPFGGSGTRYFVGDFDGKVFTASGPSRWADKGRDFYAAVSWGDIPAADGRRLWLGWMNNWKYGQDIPTEPWRSAQSLVRSLDLVRVGDELHLAQTPASEYARLRGNLVERAGLVIHARREVPDLLHGRAVELEVSLEPGRATECGLTVFRGSGAETRIGYDRERGEIFLDRTRSGAAPGKDFAGRHFAAWRPAAERVELRIFLDHSLIEVFTADGTVVLSDQVFPPEGADGIGVFATGDDARMAHLRAWPLRSVWEK